MAGREDWWYDEAAGPLVRPYAMVRGRTRPLRPELHLVTQVRAMPSPSDPDALSVEHLEIMELCRRPLSVAEVAAYLDVHSYTTEAILIGLTSWPWAARAVRAQTFSLKTREFVDVARLSGRGTRQIIATELAPNNSG